MSIPRKLLVLLLSVSCALASAGCAGLPGADPSSPAGTGLVRDAQSLDAPQAVVAPTAEPPETARARTLLAASTAKGQNWDGEIRSLDVGSAPDGLADLVVLRRAEADMRSDDPGAAIAELGRPEMRNSTNRLLLEQAGRVAEKAGDSALAGDLYARGAGYFGWTAERVRMYLAAGAAYKAAGLTERAVEQYETVVENYTWTKAADEAGDELWSMGSLTSYHGGILLISQGKREEGMSSLAEAAKGGPYVSEARTRLYSTDDAVAWARADDEGTVASYQEYRTTHPYGSFVAESRFQEGLVHYQAERFSQALAVWDDAASGEGGAEQARALLWAAKALDKLGETRQSGERLRAASESRPAGYYAVRARDLLEGRVEWARASGLPVASPGDDRVAVDKWIDGWAKPSKPDASLELRAKRGLGLASLGLAAEADAELNAAVADSQDPRFLFGLATTLAELELWTPASRAAGKVASLSPARSFVGVPPGLQGLIYPPAYRSLVTEESNHRGIDPVLLLSLVFQESRYDPFAISYADARGLTQVMPSTGKAMAPSLGLYDFTADDLYQPGLALQMGASYLAEQLKSFDGDPFRALAAYNAGSGPLKRWASPDPDLFVERIDYSQTRDYVRQIYLHYAIYRALAEGR